MPNPNIVLLNAIETPPPDDATVYTVNFEGWVEYREPEPSDPCRFVRFVNRKIFAEVDPNIGAFVPAAATIDLDEAILHRRDCHPEPGGMWNLTIQMWSEGNTGHVYLSRVGTGPLPEQYR